MHVKIMTLKKLSPNVFKHIYPMYVLVLVKIDKTFQNAGSDHCNHIFGECHVGTDHYVADAASTTIFHHNLYDVCGLQCWSAWTKGKKSQGKDNGVISNDKQEKNKSLVTHPDIIVVLITAVVACDIFAVTFLQNLNLIHQLIELFFYRDDFDRPKLVAWFLLCFVNGAVRSGRWMARMKICA